MVSRRMFLKWVGVSLVGSVALPANAHEGHLTIPEEQAIAKGRDLVALLVKRGKLEGAWTQAAVENATLQIVEELEQWHIVFQPPEGSDPEQPALHVFLNYDGQFLGASFGDGRN